MLMPMLAPTNDSAPWIRNGSSKASTTCLATCSGISCESRSGSSRRNSSDPCRATRSIVRATSRRREAAWRSSSSPAARPRLSLTMWKRSRSTNSTASPQPVAPPRPRQRQLEVLLEEHAVGQAGDAVVARQVADLLLRALAVADVARESEEQQLVAARIEQADAHLHRERRAVLAAVHGLHRRRPAARRARAHVVERLLAQRRIHLAQAHAEAARRACSRASSPLPGSRPRSGLRSRTRRSCPPPARRGAGSAARSRRSPARRPCAC